MFLRLGVVWANIHLQGLQLQNMVLSTAAEPGGTCTVIQQI